MKYINPAIKLYHHLDRIAAIGQGKRPAPVNVEIDISNRCQLGCRWCHFGYTHSRGPLAISARPTSYSKGGDLMDSSLAFSIIDQLEEYGVRSITWSGGGEPTLHPDFDKLVDYTSIDQGLYTNGGYIKEERARLLREKLKWVYISLDYANAKSYAAGKQIGLERFDDACKGIENLALAPGLATIGIGFLLHKSNWQDIDNMIKLAYEAGADYVQFRPTVYYDLDRPDQRTEDTGWMSQCIARLKRLPPKLADFRIEVDVARFEMYRDWQDHGYKTCWWSAMQAVITPNGKMWACLNKRSYDGYELGDLNQQSFKDIWTRAPVQCVDDKCRVFCRGHIPNLNLNQMIRGHEPHHNFI